MKIMIVFGTRPEAIKMCPLVNELKKHRKNINTIVCVTGQHRQMLNQVLDTFNVAPDYDLSIMKDKQTLFDITSNVLNGIKSILEILSDTDLTLKTHSSGKSSDMLTLEQGIARCMALRN